MLTYNYPLYNIHFPKYWLVRDEPRYINSATENNSARKELLFHISQNDYLSTVATILRFVEESIYSNNINDKMRELELKALKNVIADLLYVDKNYKIVRKEN